jgi:MATE family multidrug resistance protein
VISPLFTHIRTRWRAPGGYLEVLKLALPLILSTGSWAIQHFVDRMFLAWYSTEALAAAMPAGMTNFAVLTPFLGTAGYVSTFAAQYYGAGRKDRIGPALWQGIYVALIGAVPVMLSAFWAGDFFTFIGHELAVRRYESVYYFILAMGSVPALVSSAMGGYFSGLGRTRVVMWVNILATAVNLLFDYLLIFGAWGFPRWGMAGAAIATVLSAVVSVAVYGWIIFGRKNESDYKTRSGWRFDRALFGSLIKFGFPNGIQFFVDMAGFTVFILLVGRLGSIPLAATNIAFNVNTLAFMPMIGFGIAASVLVGQNLGRKDPQAASYGVWSAFHLTFAYMLAVSLLYVLTPNLFLAPFAARSDPAQFAAIKPMAVVLLRFVALYSLFDGMNIIFSGAIKGAGDTRFVMYMVLLVSLFGLTVPSFIGIVLLGWGIYASWGIATFYVCLLGLSFFLRFLTGKWKTMSVIEPATPVLAGHPEAPMVECEP